MEVVFNTTCVTVFGKYVKGRTYNLDTEQAKQFIKEGLADAVKKEQPKRKTTSKK